MRLFAPSELTIFVTLEMPPTVTYVVSNVSDSKEYDQLAANWDPTRYELAFVLLNPAADCGLQRNIRDAGHRCDTFVYRGSRDALKAFRWLIRYFARNRPDIVHTNLLDAALIGLAAARWCGIPATVNTRHHSLHNHKYHPVKGVFYDRLINRLARRTIAISEGTAAILREREGLAADRIVMLHHGFDLSLPREGVPRQLEDLRRRYDLDRPDGGPLLGIISRPFDWKGLDHAIPALARILREIPSARVLLFNWKDTPFSERYEAMLADLPAGSWRTIDFDPLVDQMYHLFDVFIHVPEDRYAEAFGLVYVEALLAGTPSVFTRSGILNDIDAKGLAGVHIVPFRNSDAIAEAVLDRLALKAGPAERKAWAESNRRHLGQWLDIRDRMERLFALYDELLDGPGRPKMTGKDDGMVGR